MKITMGTCGRCGGPVTVPGVFMSVIPPTPQCERCGAVPVEAHGPVLPMQSGYAPSTTKIDIKTNTGES